ncbi:MAG: trigger factor, partial [Oscillospiraceae bacterium]|nr:trigger factor [Oscillospiraceae bacterium]
IEATDEDIDKELQKMADMYKMEIEKVRELMASSLDGMKNEIVINKTLEFLVDKSTVKRAKKKGVNEE